MNRDFLAHTLNLKPHKQIPILYSMTTTNSNIQIPNEDNSIQKKSHQDENTNDVLMFEIKSNK